MLKLALGIGIVFLAGSVWAMDRLPEHPSAAVLRPVSLDPDSPYLTPPSAPNGGTDTKPLGGGGPNDERVAEAVARAMQADLNGDFPAAIAAMTQALALDPKNAQILAMRGYVRLQMRDIPGAVRDIDAGVKLNARDVTVRSAQANLYLAQQQTQDAMNIANDLIRDNPEMSQLFELRAHIHLMQQNKEKAAADLDEAVRLSPDNAEVHLERAEFFISVDDWHHALEDVDEFLLQMPDSMPAHNIRGYALTGLGRQQEALREFDKVIAAQPTAQAYYGRAWARPRWQPDDKIADLDAALKIDPKLGGAYRMQGQIYLEEADFPAAIKALGNSLRLMPNDETGARKLAASYAGDRQYEAAIRELDRIADSHPPDVTLLMDRCRYKALKKVGLDDALADCNRAASLDPMSDEVREARAFAYQRFGQTEKALDTYKDILTRRPNSAVVHFGRAVAEAEAHSPEQAKADFAAAREADVNIDLRVASYLVAPKGYESPNQGAMTFTAVAKGSSASGGKSPDDKVTGPHSKWRPASIVAPKYPTGAEDDQVEGYVDFVFIIEPDGSVGDPRVEAEMPEAYGLADAAVKVFPKWKFTPQSVNGSPVPTKAYYRFTFKLR